MKKKFDKDSRNYRVTRKRNPTQIKAKHKTTKIKENINGESCQILKHISARFWKGMATTIVATTSRISGTTVVAPSAASVCKFPQYQESQWNPTMTTIQNLIPQQIILCRIEAKLPNLALNKLYCIRIPINCNIHFSQLISSFPNKEFFSFVEIKDLHNLLTKLDRLNYC